MLCYFDSSIVLAILLDESRKSEALDLWNNASIRISSILLKLETITVLRRTYENNKSSLKSSWITMKQHEMNEYLNEVNYRILDESIENIIMVKKELSQCRTLDAIHIATAMELSTVLPASSFYLYTFDKKMSDLARKVKFITNTLSEEVGI